MADDYTAISRSELLALATVITLEIALLSKFLASYLGFDESETLGILISAVLTVVLIGIYYRQNRILDRQTEIQSAAHHPVVVPIDSQIGAESPSSYDTTESSDHVILELRNSGNEVAIDLALECRIKYDGINQPITTSTRPLKRGEHPQRAIDGTAGVLSADDEPVIFYTLVRFEQIDGVEPNPPFTTALRPLLESDIETIKIGFFVTYFDTTGEKYTVPVPPAFKLDVDSVSPPLTLAEFSTVADRHYPEDVFDTVETMRRNRE